MKLHKDLDVWRVAVDLATEVYGASKAFPKDEQFGMISQIRRSAVSIASNIAAGAARQGHKEFVQFLYIALGSASELDTQLEIAKRVGLAKSAVIGQLQENTTRVGQMLRGLVRSVKKSDAE